MDAENLALRKESQQAFNNAMKSIKKLIKVGKVKVPKSNDEKQDSGVVLLEHIPHGFYEKQMELFFGQFGKVTNLKLYRSKKSGRSLGYAFIEFKMKEIAAIVAETMNNYLMFTKLLKASVVQNPGPKIFMGRKFDETNCAGAFRRRREQHESTKKLDEKQAKRRLAKGNSKLNSMKKKLNQLGVDLDIQVAGNVLDANATNSSMVSVDFSSDEEISVRMKRKSVVDAVNVPNLVKKSAKNMKTASTVKSTKKAPKKSLSKKRKSVA
ncbi:MKI67 FHA domain-interacting nucleolar phosphoprotein-like [Cloeon dipterum]|uniref:MKI67 FHA domain-interacting nucleolar phosphoprotein-like n=1 Tax=Cloeon dipterum TaxID=197152 RepID=UPI00321FD77F